MTDLKTRNREALKALREQRPVETEAAQARLKEQVNIQREIVRVLKEGPMTAPALAEAIGYPTNTVFWHLIALKKYGDVVEAAQEGDYFQYRLTSET
jgi:predicted ArsR family transcriptional regulator